MMKDSQSEEAYRSLLRSIYKELDLYEKEPLDFSYDLLNMMAQDLYDTVRRPDEYPFEFDFKDSQRVGRDLRTLRVALGFGQRELARTLGITHRPISDVERGKYTPSIAKIYQYIQGLRSLSAHRYPR